MLVCFCASLAACSKNESSAPEPQNYADYVFLNATVYTVNDDAPEAQAVAVADNKIVYVGSTDDAYSFIGGSTEVLDLSGGMLLPGFVDAHEHLIASLWILSGANLYSATSREEYIEIIQEYAAANPEKAVVQAAGWTAAGWGDALPTADELDEIVSDRPLFLIDAGVHDALLNGVALRQGNITRETKDKVPGTSFWTRDADGNPTGYALEFQWVQTYIDVGGWNPEVQIPESMDFLYRTAIQGGITSVMIPGIGTAPSLLDAETSNADFVKIMEMLQRKDEAGELDIRTVTMPFFKAPDAEAERTAEFADEMRQRFNSDMLKTIGIKIHPESSWMSHGAPMLEPYIDDGTSGGFGVSPERMMALVLAANKRGLDVATHAEGSASTRAAIDAFEAARNAGYLEARNSLHHLMWAHPDDIARLKPLNITVNSTPEFTNASNGVADAAYAFVGEERIETMFGMYSELPPMGVRLNIAADHPGSTADMIAPLFIMQSAITLVDPKNPDMGRFPSNRRGLTIEEAIRAFTIDAAYTLRLEEKVGSIEVGKYADLVVLAEDIRHVPAEELKDVAVLATMMNGRFTHRKGL